MSILTDPKYIVDNALRQYHTEFKVPNVGDSVVYYNSHGFPRAALVTGNEYSLEGEQHVQLIDNIYTLHLVVFSPLPRMYYEMLVPHTSLKLARVHLEKVPGLTYMELKGRISQDYHYYRDLAGTWQHKS